jgi:general secretion pathway protein G
MTMRSSTPSRGFTLLELLVVVAIVGILAAIALPALQSAIDKTKQRASMADMRTVAHAIEVYGIDRGHLPAGGTTLAPLVPFLVPYATTALPERDGWQNAFFYESDGRNYSIFSYGKDGVDGPDITPDTRFEFDRDLILSDGVFVASVE